MKTLKFQTGQRYKALVFGDEVIVMKRTECTVEVRGTVNGRYRINHSISREPEIATEFFSAKNRDKNGVPKTWVFYAEDIVEEST